MDIRDHRFPDCWHGLSPNHGGRLEAPRFLVMHYTAGWSGEGARDYLMDPSAPYTPSAHLVVGRDGRAWQIVPFDTKAWHAGRSYYRGVRGLNHCSIGIEIDNIGWLKPTARGYLDPYGGVRRVEQGWVIGPYGRYCREDDLVFASHPHAGPAELAWPPFAEAQLATLERLTRAVLAAYPSIREVIGHDDIRADKTDPGPAFPMARFKALVGDGADDAAEDFVATVTLNVRGGPGTGYETLGFGPLPAGTPVQALAANGDWRFVALADDPARQGWVHGFYLRCA